MNSFWTARPVDTFKFKGVVARPLVVEFDPVFEGDFAEPHGYKIFGTMAEGAVGEGGCGGNGPIRVGRRSREGEVDGHPYWGS